MSSETRDALLLREGFSPVTVLAERLRAEPDAVGPFVNEVLDHIAERDGALRAFSRVLPETVQRRAAALSGRDGSLPLYGVPVGVKDLIDTEDEVTEYGSALYQGHRPEQDAEVVRRLRGAGAVIVGKTVTTEFALFNPPATRNPHDPARTPGGSSSGSAAAVAAGLVPVALGTQTAGSVLRPASYCGVVGFKPGFNVLDRRGVRELSRSFDTLGLFARSVEDLKPFFDALGGGAPDGSRRSRGRPRVALGSGGAWSFLDPDCRAVVRGAGDRLAAAGFDVVDSSVDGWLAELAGEQSILMAYEAWQSLKPLVERDAEALSPLLRRYLEEGAGIPMDRALDAMVRISRWQSEWGARLGGVDAVLIPSAQGEAPHAAGTGDLFLCRAATALGVPAVSLPIGCGRHGLPIGVQLIGRRGEDWRLLDLAETMLHLFDGRPVTA
ncbi:amidase [Arthrobacter sp. NPDC090010]|uniref:amidase n=1 Tax=Arthrobacter sp. NPDC090010 TaxID=3363942 RepID=UPI00380D37AF